MSYSKLQQQYIDNARRANHRALEVSRLGYDGLAADSRVFRDFWIRLARIK